MRILVTGGCGFIGSHLVDAHVALGDDVIVVDNLSNATGYENSNATYIREDITNLAAMRSIFTDLKPDIVNHHAAKCRVRESENLAVEYINTNVQGTVNVLTASIDSGAKKFIFASSGGTIYGDTLYGQINEHRRPAPKDVYGKTKMQAEYWIEHLARDKIMTTCLRYSNVYGARQSVGNESGAIANFITNVLALQPFSINGDGSKIRDFVYIKDVVQANILAAHRNEYGSHVVVNIGTGIATNILTLSRMIYDEFLVNFPDLPLSYEYQIIYMPDVPNEVQRNVLHCGRAASMLGWIPGFTLQEGLKDFRETMTGVSK